jgi:hypothetical protein
VGANGSLDAAAEEDAEKGSAGPEESAKASNVFELLLATTLAAAAVAVGLGSVTDFLGSVVGAAFETTDGLFCTSSCLGNLLASSLPMKSSNRTPSMEKIYCTSELLFISTRNMWPLEFQPWEKSEENRLLEQVTSRPSSIINYLTHIPNNLMNKGVLQGYQALLHLLTFFPEVMVWLKLTSCSNSLSLQPNLHRSFFFDPACSHRTIVLLNTVAFIMLE